MPPTIGVTRCGRLDDYVASIEQAGGRVRVLEVTESPKTVLAEIDGLLLTGGGDIDPVFYREDRHPSVQDAEPGRDEFELDLTRRALDAGLPVLAICRGSQVLNVAAGGTLVQDIPTTLPTGLPHAVNQPKNALVHDIAVTPGSRLHQALRPAGTDVRVNSRHHQAIGSLGRGLTPSAAAPDGIIEAVEAPQAGFCIGVQWHPENFWKTGEFNGLFEAFVAAAVTRTRRA